MTRTEQLNVTFFDQRYLYVTAERNGNSSFSKELRTVDILLLLQRQVSNTHLKVKTCGPEPFSDHFTHFWGLRGWKPGKLFYFRPFFCFCGIQPFLLLI